MCCGSAATYITLMATLDPLLSASPYMDSDVSTFTTYAPDRPLVSYSQVALHCGALVITYIALAKRPQGNRNTHCQKAVHNIWNEQRWSISTYLSLFACPETPSLHSCNSPCLRASRIAYSLHSRRASVCWRVRSLVH